jgi:MOSC domain-containing protein YiiM
MSGEIYKISVSTETGSRKENVESANLAEDFGIVGDAHAGSERQVSLLPFEAFAEIREKVPLVKPGDFAENITTRGLDISPVSIGDRICIGAGVRLVITHIGKECHRDCCIREAVGDCIMPRMGLFARVVAGGTVRVGDMIRWEPSDV